MEPPSNVKNASLKHEEKLKLERQLLTAIKDRRQALAELLETCSDHWRYEDSIYRFYHQSFKVYAIQDSTATIVVELQSLMPERELNPFFRQIVEEGTGNEFEMSCNDDWLRHTRPIVEALFHARFMLEMCLRYADLEEPPQSLPSGWAAVFYLYGLR